MTENTLCRIAILEVLIIIIGCLEQLSQFIRGVLTISSSSIPTEKARTMVNEDQKSTTNGHIK